MTKISRNAPCPCGSGKKYKRCCWPREGAAAPARVVDDSSTQPVVIWHEDDFEELTNSVAGLLRNGRVEEAERAAKELLERYPETVEGLEKMAMVEEARGNQVAAAEYYRQAAHFAQTNPGFDPEVADNFTLQAERLENQSPPALPHDR